MKRILLLLIFWVGLLHSAVQVSTDKNIYESDENIILSVVEMSGVDDWIGIYEKSKTNDWENVVAWVWGAGLINGDITVDGGVSAQETKEYEARVFFANGFELKAQSTSFTVNQLVLNTIITPSKEIYLPAEEISIHVEGMLGTDEDWIAIYPKNKNSDWENVIAWKWSNGIKSGDITFAGIVAGEYEVRAFFQNSFIFETKAEFSVFNKPIPPTIYEDAEDGLTQRWESQGANKVGIRNDGYDSAKAVYMIADWQVINGVWVNRAHYQLTDINHINWNNTTHHILEFDHRTNGSPCFIFGIYINTLQGVRVMNWSMWYERQGMAPTKIVYDDGYTEIVYPYNDGMLAENTWTAHKINLDVELKRVEPDNRILSVNAFYTTGGQFYDNIRLVSE